MKRLITALSFSLGLVFANVASVAAYTTWQLDMFDPTASTVNRTLNIEYKVFSIEETDEFEVTLFQNNVEVSSRSVTTDHGDSGVFTVNIPATGTYTYKIVAENDNDPSNPETESRTVQVVDGPAPTVTTVFVNNAAANGGQGTGGAAAAGNNAGGQGAGTVAAAATGEADAEAANTEDSSNNQGDVLGAEAAATAATSSSRKGLYTGIVALVLAAVAGAYYFLRIRSTHES